MRLINSAFYGSRAKKNSISHALVILGLNSARNAIISLSVFDAFPLKKWNCLDANSFSSHSIAMATISKFLAEKTRRVSADGAFVAGLLHDVGKIIMAQFFKEHFARIWDLAKEKSLSFANAEEDQVPFNHAQIGYYFAKKWQFPNNLTDAIQHHHTPSTTAEDSNLLLIVHMANQIDLQGASFAGLKSDLYKLAPEIAPTLAHQVATLSEWYSRLAQEVKSACGFFLDGARG